MVDGVCDDDLTESLIECILLLLLLLHEYEYDVDEQEEEDPLRLLLLGSSIADFTDSETRAATAAARLLAASREVCVELTLTDEGGS